MKNKTEAKTTLYTVQVSALVKKKLLDSDDKGVAGYYDFELPDNSETWTDSKKATYVLDEFHRSIAIAVLDDFSISVINPDGNEIFEDFGN